MQTVSAKDAEFAVEMRGLPVETAPLQLVWAHGWGQDRRAFAAMAQSLDARAASLMPDLPGFGQSPPPPEGWGTADYADAFAEWLAGVPRAEGARRLWIGHSYGGRVGIQLAARHPEAVDGLFLIAAAGLQRRRGPLKRATMAARVWRFKLLKALARDEAARERLRARFGSADYRNAGPMRPVFLRAVREDLSETARAVRCPVALVYGEGDTETPPEFGRRYAELMPDARCHLLPGQDHYSVLGAGRHQTLQRLTDFAETL